MLSRMVVGDAWKLAVTRPARGATEHAAACPLPIAGGRPRAADCPGPGAEGVVRPGRVPKGLAEGASRWLPTGCPKGSDPHCFADESPVAAPQVAHGSAAPALRQRVAAKTKQGTWVQASEWRQDGEGSAWAWRAACNRDGDAASTLHPAPRALGKVFVHHAVTGNPRWTRAGIIDKY